MHGRLTGETFFAAVSNIFREMMENKLSSCPHLVSKKIVEEICSECQERRPKLHRAGFKCVEALGRIIIRGTYPPSNAIIYMHLQL